jgi:hypothetical protein
LAAGVSLPAADLERFLAQFDAEAATVAVAARDAVLQVFPEALETADGKDVGYGTSAGYKGLVFVISPKRRAVNLGVARGASLPDPDGLMSGAGKVHRHVELRSVEAARDPALHRLMERALARHRSGG